MTAPAPLPPEPGVHPVRHGPRLAALATVVLLLHALLLAGLPPGRASDAAAAPARPLSVRQIVLPAASAEAAEMAEMAEAPTPQQAPAPAAAVTKPTSPRALRDQAPALSAPAPALAPPPALARAPEPELARPPEPELDPASAEQTELLAAIVAVAAAGPAGGEAPPTYATRRPPAALLRYELRRGPLTGQGELNWQPAATGYALQIEGSAFGVQVLSWVSQGGYDNAGLAPQRYTDRRNARAPRAANFQRDKGVISFSGGGSETTLLAGAQDRLSWMVQLAAIIEADPARYHAGQRVVMQVAGARGDADVWTFNITGHEAVDVAGARIERCLVVRRASRKPYDTQIEAWLDPARNHLPVRLKLSSAGGSDGMEFVLKP